MEKSRKTRAVVLGGGGSVGRAWQTGLATGLLSTGVDLGSADLIIGTSAGAQTGARIALGIDKFNDALVVDDGPLFSPSPSAAIAMQNVMAAMARAAESSEPELVWRDMGQFALTAPEVADEDTCLRRPTLAAITGLACWPSHFQATSVSVDGQFKVWTKDSHVPLEKAIAASTALPGRWPAITIDGVRFIDGGIRSMLNADLAAGHDVVLIISSFQLDVAQGSPNPRAARGKAVAAELNTLRESGSVVRIIWPSTPFLALTKNGTRMQDNTLVPDAYELGKRQGLEISEEIRSAWDV